MRLLSEAHVQISSLEAKDSQRCWLVFVSHVLVGGEGQLAPYTRENNVTEHIRISSEKQHVVKSFYISHYTVGDGVHYLHESSAEVL